METTLPTGRRGQIVAVGVTLIAILALWQLIVSPIAGFYFDRSDRLAERRRVEQHMEQLVAARQELVEQVANLGDAVPVHNVLDGSSIPVATAALQSIAQEVAATAGATLTSVESLPGETGNGYRRVSLKLALTTSWPILIHFLEALQQSDTPMAIDNLQIHGSAQAAQSGQAGTADKQLFDAAFTIHAPASAGAPQSGDKPAGDRPAAGKPGADEPSPANPGSKTTPAAPQGATPPDAPAEEAPAGDTQK
jgi:general secretion pathway protein M